MLMASEDVDKLSITQVFLEKNYISLCLSLNH